MKRWLSISMAAAAGLLSILNAHAGEIPVKSSDVRAVTLYRSGAEVSRTFSASLPSGTSILVVSELSPYLDPQTLRCEGVSGASATILNVSHRYDYTGPEKMLPEVARLQDSLDVLNRMKVKISSQIAVCQEEQNLLLANKSVGGANTGLKTEDLRSMAAFFRERLTEIKDKMADLSEKDKQISKKIQSISQQIEELRNRRNPPQNTSTILIEVSCQAETRASFRLSYFTTMASWTPSYDVKVENLTGPVILEFTADITQDTWEKWDDVKLTVSTGNVSSGNNKPELYPWYLQFMQPVAIYDRMMEVAAPAAASGAMPDSGVKMKTMSDEVSVEQTSFATEYEIGVPVSVLSDGKPRSVQVKTYQLSASYKYHVIPKLDTDAFLVAHVTGWQDLGLVPAGTSIYYQGGYVGSGTLDTRQTNDTLLVSLGRDPAIQVKREKLKDVEGNKTIGNNRVKEYRFEITVKNTRKENIQVVISDQLPVSMDKDIEVKPLELSGAERNEATGELKWDIRLAPGEVSKKMLGFSVKFPRDKQIFNL